MTTADTAVTPKEWSRLSPRVIWVDLVITVISIIPGLVALAIARSDDNAGIIWPLVGLAAFGVIGAAADALRWVFTFYRVKGAHVELRTGVIFRQHRSVSMDRIRSVDIEAKLRHRVAGLRTVTIGAGQQSTAGESAFVLDALASDDATRLQSELMNARRVAAESADESPADGPDGDTTEPLEVFATFRPGWVVYNMFNIWAYLMALGLIGGVWGITSMIGVDPFSWIIGAYDWSSLSWFTIAVIILVAVTVLGWIGLSVNYFTEFWNFRLTRVPGPDGTQLRTSKGLFTTKEINRAEHRIRGVQLSEPTLYRWLGVTDTHVITTGLDMNSMSDPAAILPRTDRATARRVAAEVLGEEQSLFDVPLTPHPTRALRRRLWWATLITLAAAVVIAVTVPQFIAAALLIWAITLTFGWISYRNLGHAIVGPYLIIRHGMLNRNTVIVRRDAISTIAESESILQKRLGLRSVQVMTAAGHGAYYITDVDVRTSTALAEEAAPGLLEEFTVDKPTPKVKKPAPGRRIPAPDLARGVMLLLIAMAYAAVYVNAEFGVSAAGEPWWDQAATAFSTLFLDNRAFPMFAILFGYGLAWSVRRQQERNVDELDIRFSLRRRAGMLLAIGFVHAVLVYSGEILMSYGLAILLTGWMLFRPDRVMRRAAVVFASFYLVTATAGMMFMAYGRAAGEVVPGAAGYSTAGDWIERIAFAPFSPIYLTAVYPLLLLVVLGYLAGRHRLIENPTRPLIRRIAVIGVSASVLGAVPSLLVFLGVADPGWFGEGASMALQVLTGVAGGAGYVALFALYSGRIVALWRTGAEAVMAMGKRSLTFYLLNSTLVAVVLNVDLVGLDTGALGALGVAFGAWLVSLFLAVVLERAGKQGPMEALMRRVVKG